MRNKIILDARSERKIVAKVEKKVLAAS